MWSEPIWSRAARVRAAMTERAGGVSDTPFSTLNLGAHVGDRSDWVATNRERLRVALGVEAIAWLDQVHGNDVADIDLLGPAHIHTADAAVVRKPGIALAIMVADCLPVLLARDDGSAVAAAHAGWRGLANGVIEGAVVALGVPAREITCWLGPSISAAHYEVDTRVRSAFGAEHEASFRSSRPGHWHMDLLGVARAQLTSLGVTRINVSGLCVYREADRYFSHRREQPTGRCAALVWLA